MIKFFKSISWIIKKHWYLYLIVLFFGIIAAILNLFPSRVIGNLTGYLEEGTLTKDILIYQILIPYLTLSFALYFFIGTRRIFQNVLSTSNYFLLQNRFMGNILDMDGTFFEKYQSGDLLSRALGDINEVKFTAGNRLIILFLEVLTVIITFVALIFINWKLAILCFIPLSFIVVTNVLLKQKVQRNWKMVREKNAEMSNVLLESITNVRTVRAYSKEEENLTKNLKYSKEVYEVEVRNLKVNVAFEPIFQFIVGVSTLICYAMGAYFYYTKQINLSDLVTFALYLGLFQSPLKKIGNIANKFYQSLISVDRLNEIYNSKNNIKSSDLELETIDAIEFKDFKFKYPLDNYNSLNGVSLKINRGMTVGIVGKTGCGKSTLVRQLVRQYETDDNSIFINGINIEKYSLESIRKNISYVPQEHTLFSKDVYANILLGKEDSSETDVMNAIKNADFEKDIENLSDGLNTIVGEYGVTLSGGQKQRLSIARAFLKNSDVLILDDSLSAVDGKTEANIISNLKEFRNGKTNIIVCHRLSAVKHADLIIVLSDGKIIEEGNHKSLMELGGWYASQYKSQQMKEGDLDE